MYTNNPCLTVRVHLLGPELWRCEAVSELLAAVYVRIQSQELLAWQRGIREQSVQTVTAGAICGETA